MIKYKLIPAIVFFVMTTACDQKPQPDNTIDEVLDLFVTSVNQKDLTPLNDVFSSKAKVYEQGSVDESWEAYRDGHLGNEIKEMQNLKFSFDIKETISGSEAAIARGNYLVKGIMGSKTINSAGLVTLGLAVEDDKWKIVHLQFSRKCTSSAGGHDHGGATEAQPKAKSPKSMAMGEIGDAHIHIDYYSPRVRDREIYGALVPYDKVWATGAHRAVAINFPVDVKINETKVPAGKYGFFTIPGKEEWVLILNKIWDQHMSDEYDQKDDVVRVKVKPTVLNNNQEELLYEVIQTGDANGQIEMSWAKIKVTLPIELL